MDKKEGGMDDSLRTSKGGIYTKEEKEERRDVGESLERSRREGDRVLFSRNRGRT